jgi:hypothetical protein
MSHPKSIVDEIVVVRLLNPPLQAWAVSLIIAFLAYLAVKSIQNILSEDRNANIYPPGPPRRPFIGALTSFPKHHAYKRFTEWAATYGMSHFLR